MSRSRLLEQTQGGPAERRFRVMACAAAAMAYVSSIVALALGSGARPGALAALAVCILAPAPVWIGARRLRRFLGFDAPPLGVWVLVSLGGVIALGAQDSAFLLPAVFAAALGYLIARLDDDRVAVWCGPVAGLLSLAALSASAAVAALVPLTLVAAVAAHLLLDARITRRRVVSRALGTRATPETAAGADRRVAYAVPLAGVLLVLALAAAPVSRTPPWKLFDGSGRRADGTRPEPDENRGRGVAESDGVSFSDQIAYGAVPLPAYEVIGEVVLRDGERLLGDIGPIRLRGVVLSQITVGGVRMRDTRLPTRRRDEEDGVLDGRVQLRRSWGGPTLTAEISQYPIPIEPEGWSLLFSLEPLESVGLDDVRYDPDRLLVATQAPDDWFTYDVDAAWPGAVLQTVGAARATHPDGRFVQLPAATPTLRRVAELGRSITAGVDTDLERVKRLTDHFRTDFEYTLEETTLPGIAGLDEFLDRRSGYCSHYALVAVAMLRSQGLPARVVTGFLTQEWSEDEAAYQVRPRDTHAWFEVHFENVGWVAFDATPPDVRRAAIERDAENDAPGAAAWAGSLVDRIGALVRGDADGVSLVDVLALVRAAPPSVIRGLVALLALLAAGTLALRLRASLRERPQRVTRTHHEVDDVYARLVAALGRRGYRKHAAQTPREFAARTAAAGGVGIRPLVPITEDLYAVRFGEQPLTDELRERVRTFIRELA